MKDTPLRLYDISVRMKWDIETAAEYEKNVHDIMRYTEMRGKPLAIEYIDENLNVIKTLKIKGDEKKFLEYEARTNEFLRLLNKENE